MVKPKSAKETSKEKMFKLLKCEVRLERLNLGSS